MNTFLIYWKDNATMRQVAKLEKAILAIENDGVTQEDDYFEAELEWGTSTRDVANLKGRLNRDAENIVDRIEVDDAG